MYGYLKHKRIIPIWFIVTCPKAYRMSDCVNTDYSHQESIHQNLHTILNDERRQNCDTQKAARQWTNTQRREKTDPFFWRGEFLIFPALQIYYWGSLLSWAHLTWMHVGMEKSEIHIRYPHTSQTFAFSARDTSLHKGKDIANCLQDGKNLDCCLAEEHASKPLQCLQCHWAQATCHSSPQGRSTARCYSPSAPRWAGVYLAQQLTGSAFISPTGKHLRLKIGDKKKELLLMHLTQEFSFFTMDQYFILSC